MQCYSKQHHTPAVQGPYKVSPDAASCLSPRCPEYPLTNGIYRPPSTYKSQNSQVQAANNLHPRRPMHSIVVSFFRAHIFTIPSKITGRRSASFLDRDYSVWYLHVRKVGHESGLHLPPALWLFMASSCRRRSRGHLQPRRRDCRRRATRRKSRPADPCTRLNITTRGAHGSDRRAILLIVYTRASGKQSGCCFGPYRDIRSSTCK